MPGFVQRDKWVRVQSSFKEMATPAVQFIIKNSSSSLWAIFLVKPLCNNKLLLQQIFSSDPALTIVG